MVVVAILKYAQHKSRFMFYLCCLLVSILVVESYGMYHSFFKTGVHTILVYKIFTFFEFGSIVLLYKSLIKNTKKRKFINIISVVFLAVYFATFLVIKTKPFELIPYESLIISVIIIVYLTELLQSERIINYKKYLPFWISVGLFVFYTSSIPFFSMYKFMRERNLIYVLILLAILMNILIGFGLLWSKMEEKY